MWRLMYERKRTKFKDKGAAPLGPILLLLFAVAISTGDAYLTNDDFLCTFEQPLCQWFWNRTERGYKLTEGTEAFEGFIESGSYAGPFTDARNKSYGHFLKTTLTDSNYEVQVWSIPLVETLSECNVSVWLNMKNMTDGKFIVIADGTHPWVIEEIQGNSEGKWERFEVNIGSVIQKFRIVLAVSAGKTFPAHVSLDEIELHDCFPVVNKPGRGPCEKGSFQCSTTKDDYCVKRSHICDIKVDCINGADEQQDCDKIPVIGRCNFDDSWCGWHNSPDTSVRWIWLHGEMGYTKYTGRLQNYSDGNVTGKLMFSNTLHGRIAFGAQALLESTLINPPPLYHSRPESEFFCTCKIRFFYHHVGTSSGSFSLFLIEHAPQGDKTTRLFYTYKKTKMEYWFRTVATLPTNIKHAYTLQFEYRKGLRFGGGLVLDDISMSRECFGIGVPEEEMNGYNYDTFKGFPEPTLPTETYSDFVNKTVYKFTTCGSTGRKGPTAENCTKAYKNTKMNVTVVMDPPISGIQKWTVPETNFYTIIAKGAAGGQGSDGVGSSKGATAIGIIKLFARTNVYMLIGQEGHGGCRQNFAMIGNSTCARVIPPRPTPPGPRYSPPRISSRKSNRFGQIFLKYSAGGGGGGTFVYQIREGVREALAVGGGGGGLGGAPRKGEVAHHGRGLHPTRSGVTGSEFGENHPGAGGGWRIRLGPKEDVTGASLYDGAIGGQGCGFPKGYHGTGGFGGGGGGCMSGGGGGGFTGGSASTMWKSGRGGYSYLSPEMLERRVLEGSNNGPGAVIIIPAVEGCGCGYLCAAVDEYMEQVICICPDGKILEESMTSCKGLPTTTETPKKLPDRRVIMREELVFALLVIAIIAVLCFTGQIIYKCRKKCLKRNRIRRAVAEPEPPVEIQLHRLPQVSENIMTEENPDYEVAAANLGLDLRPLRDVKKIPRDSLRFDGALGQGAFGEVYKGYYKVSSEGPEIPVAIKTLPSFSSNEIESDFFMEAMIMAKFNHPNIAHLFGICFERHPRYIILELLEGGDLKNFLRDNRPHAGDPNRLVMRDLLKFARDVAQGCAYLEERRFIHRDIAARNCLLTSRGEDKTVKIADFGMARDIYRSDYYRKFGRCLLPVKWMPPEAFQDGVFTTKTDVWAYGVFLWEVMSVGFMPYTGHGNHEVMELVVRGGRLEAPRSCPSEIYSIMKLCWQRLPEARPSFTYILDRIGFCLQDPEILSIRLPLFTKSARPRIRRNGDREAGQGPGQGDVRVPIEDDFEEDDDDGAIADEDEILDQQNAMAAAAVPPSEQVTYAETDFSSPQPGTSTGIMDPEDFQEGLPFVWAPRGPLGPKGRLPPSEIIQYRMNIEMVARNRFDDLDSDDEEESTYC